MPFFFRGIVRGKEIGLVRNLLSDVFDAISSLYQENPQPPVSINTKEITTDKTKLSDIGANVLFAINCFKTDASYVDKIRHATIICRIFSQVVLIFPIIPVPK